jgi:hypothetical protein
MLYGDWLLRMIRNVDTLCGNIYSLLMLQQVARNVTTALQESKRKITISVTTFLSPYILNVAILFSCLLGLTLGSISIKYRLRCVFNKAFDVSGNYPTNIPLSRALFFMFCFTKRRATQACYENHN